MIIRFALAAVALFTISAFPLSAQIRITEWMYDGSEFIEFTNMGTLSQDMTGWSFQDIDTLATPFSLTLLGTLAPGESAVASQADAASFRTLWNLGAEVKVISYGTGILQRSDTITLYDASSVIADKLAYGDNTVGGIRTNLASGWTTVPNLGTNNVLAWQLSAVGDAQNSHTTTSGTTYTANPGTYVAAVPEPGTVALVGAGLGAMLFLLRRRKLA